MISRAGSARAGWITSGVQRIQRVVWLLLALAAAALTACAPAARQIIPTERPTATQTLTPTPSRTPGFGATPTVTPPSLTQTAGPSPTSIFGATSTPAAAPSTPTRVLNPNAPRIEFFTTDVLQVAPGDSLTLFWSVRGTRGAVIYRIETDGTRGNLWNVPPDGSLTVTTRRRDRGQVTYLLSAGEGDLLTEQMLSVPLSCPDPWFFQPPPDACPTGPSEPTTLIEQSFERGRMVYIQSRNRVYALFNDGRTPAWISFENRYNPATHPELDENFERAIPPGFVQPLRILGFTWRGNDVVRSRLGLGLQAEIGYEGFIQTVIAGTREELYLNSADGSVLLLLPGGDAWQIITLPVAP
jgi:hypothetical protein